MMDRPDILELLGERVDHRPGPVPASIVYQDDFPRDSLASHGLVGAVDQKRQVFLFIEARDDDAEGRAGAAPDPSSLCWIGFLTRHLSLGSLGAVRSRQPA